MSKTLTIFIATESGTSEAYANALKYTFKIHFNCEPQIVNLSEPESHLSQSLKNTDIFIFIVSTYGAGESPSNLKNTWFTNVVLSSPKKYFSSKPFAVFGLGDMNYIHYVAYGKYLHAILQESGGIPICPLGIGDDCGDSVEDFADWVELILFDYLEKLNIQFISLSDAHDFNRRDVDNIKIGHKSHMSEDSEFSVTPTDSLSQTIFQFLETQILKTNQLRQLYSESQDIKSTQFITLNGEPHLSNISIQGGNDIDILPRNREEDVIFFKEYFNLNLNDYIYSIGDITYQIPLPSRIYDVLYHFLNIRDAWGQIEIDKLIKYCPQIKNEIGIKKDSVSQTIKNCLSINVRETNDSTNLKSWISSLSIKIPSFSIFCQICPLNQYRTYSESINTNLEKHIIPSITIATTANGWCSNYLNVIAPSLPTRSIWARVKPNVSDFNFKLLNRPKIYFISQGVGVSPFLRIIEEKYRILNENLESGEKSRNLAKINLLMGFRNVHEDYLFRNYLWKYFNRKFYDLIYCPEIADSIDIDICNHISSSTLSAIGGDMANLLKIQNLEKNVENSKPKEIVPELHLDQQEHTNTLTGDTLRICPSSSLCRIPKLIQNTPEIADDIYGVLNDGGVVCICGSKAFVTDVCDVIDEYVLEENGAAMDVSELRGSGDILVEFG